MVFSFYNIKINKIIFLDININIKFYNYKLIIGSKFIINVYSNSGYGIFSA